jgi:hypothetical protein
MEPNMEVLVESEEQMARSKSKGKDKGKRQRPNGPAVPSPATVAEQTGRLLTERETEWLERLACDPASFAAVEREVHDQARQQADLYVAGLLAKSSLLPEMAEHIDKVTGDAEVPLRPAEKKKRPLVVRLMGGLAITVMTLYCAPRGRSGKGRGPEGSGLYPELAAYRISEGSSPNVQSEVGRQVAQLPIEQARAELGRRGLDLDEKAVRRIAGELGAQMLATRTRDLLRFRTGELPAGDEFAGKRVAVGIDGGRVRIRTLVEKILVKGKKKRRKFRIEWREPKVVILFETDEKGRMVKGSRPVIDGTLQGPDALIELVAFHLHRLGAAKAKLVTFAADGAPWIWARLDWVIAQVKLDPTRVVEVLDWCHGVHHLSQGLAALDLTEDQRKEDYNRLRGLLKEGKSKAVLAELEELAADQPEDSPVWREIRYLRKHSDAGRLRYDCFRCRGVPLGSGAIESTIRRVINLRLKGNGIYWTEENAEAVFQLRAAVVSGRWEEIVEHTREAMARNRRTDWHWTPPECLAVLNALEEEDGDLTQPSTRKQSKRSAA